MWLSKKEKVKKKNKKIPPTAQFLNWNVDENLYLKFNWPYVQICLRL
jgi:hypothetical protein